MSDTPETDAALKEQASWQRTFVSATFDGITYDSPVASLCRKLERERNEAIQRRMETILQCELLEKELDEAREQVNHYRDKLDLLPIKWDI
jgi:hypothetical protein